MKENISNSIRDEGDNPCSGCGVCALACPRDCIRIRRNENGFYAPEVDTTRCVNCGLCKIVCYKYLSAASYTPREVYSGKTVMAVVNNYFDQMSSVTSAGVASRLTSHFYEKGYNVCGVTFDPSKDDCRHILLSTFDEIETLKNSKYLQSYTVDAFASLSGNRPTVVFGTPCQIYGLRQEIIRKKIEDRFLLVDLFCRGIPSLLMWKAYKSYIQRRFGLRDFAKVKFRDKSRGWHRFSMLIRDAEGREYCQTVYNDLFYYFYLNNLTLCPSCYGCKLRHDQASSDIRLGDFWGPKYAKFDDGVSLVVLLSSRGGSAWKEIAHMFRCEPGCTADIFQSQKIGVIPVPDDYNDIREALRAERPLEQVFLEHRKRIDFDR